MILNDQQEYIVEQGVRFYKYSSEQLFQYDGLPGTGKSVVMMAIADRLVREEKLLSWREILPMAYTGQAAIVMRTKGFPNARSIHSSIYTPEYMPKTVDGKPVINTKYNIPELQLTMIPKDLSKYKLMLIDEAWMVPRRMKRDIESHGIKIIACGDSGQLPPIADSPAYLVDGKIYHLNQIMRQEEGSGIIYIANRCLQGLPINTGFYGNALVIEMDDLTDDMIANSSIVICGKNATRDTINDRVRHNILHIDSDLPTNGERVICRKNNWGVEIDGISLANGLTGTCISSPRIPSFDGKTFSMDFLPDLCNTPFLDLKCDYQYFMAPAGSKNELKNVPFNTGEKFDLAYSLTTHLAQGAEYSNGIYIEERLKDPSISRFLNNTGVTRFRNAMIYVKPNRHKLWY
jgi:exodeoxyribonuclease-5